ncbi:MAG: DUF3363 domain-containing protein [Azospirillum sp.]|nr:DUF3363 domain-containing protein [Azospirillum sp.]
MTDDDSFKPKLGRIRSPGSKPGRKYLHQVLRATALADGRFGAGFPGRKKALVGTQIGRGAAIGRLLSSRDRYAAFRQRRVIVKSRIVKLAGKGLTGARAHMRYIQRDGVTREGKPGELYDAQREGIDGKAFLARADGDRHQFRIIVAPEDGAEYEDLKPLTRRLMTQVEADLGTRLEWVAVDHFNTGHPHTHIMLRGKDDKGQDLVIAREYISQGIRERASELVTLDLGPRSDLEVRNQMRDEVEQERFTTLDRRLLRGQSQEGIVTAADSDAFQQSLRAGRLQKLARLGLVDEVAPGRWRLAPDLESTLRRMGERGDIVKTMHREMTAAGITRTADDYVIESPGEAAARPVVGRVIARGLADELNDRHYLVIDGVDGRVHYIDIGLGTATEPTPAGAILRVEPRRTEPREVDRTVVTIASAHGGRYDADIHLRHDPTATAEFAETHVRRLEAMRRATGGVAREPNGTWIIAPDHLVQAAVFERYQAQAVPVNVRTLSSLPLDRQIAAEGATWLDRELTAKQPEVPRDAGFGRELREAQARRRQWLIAQGLAREEQGRIIFRDDMLDTLRRRDLANTGRQLGSELRLTYVPTKSGERVEGVYRRAIDLASGRFAVIEKSREFTLVPWRPVLDRHLGKQVAGIMRGEGISWTIGRRRGINVS